MFVRLSEFDINRLRVLNEPKQSNYGPRYPIVYKYPSSTTKGEEREDYLVIRPDHPVRIMFGFRQFKAEDRTDESKQPQYTFCIGSEGISETITKDMTSKGDQERVFSNISKENDALFKVFDQIDKKVFESVMEFKKLSSFFQLKTLFRAVRAGKSGDVHLHVKIAEDPVKKIVRTKFRTANNKDIPFEQAVSISRDAYGIAWISVPSCFSSSNNANVSVHLSDFIFTTNGVDPKDAGHRMLDVTGIEGVDLNPEDFKRRTIVQEESPVASDDDEDATKKRAKLDAVAAADYF